MGLDAVPVQATAFKVFQLKPPTPEQPFIKGLLDPCTNSLLAPNIPAEKLYDKEVTHARCPCTQFYEIWPVHPC